MRVAKWAAWAAGLLLLLFVLGPASAGGQTLAVSPVMVQVFGLGTVTSSPAGIACGSSHGPCYVAFSSGGTATLTAAPASGWSFDSWSGCPAPSGTTCQVAVDGTSYDVSANFVGPPTATQTLSVATTGSGNVSGGGVSCGSAPPGSTCTLTALHGSMVTIRETPAAGSVFTGWGGACSGTAATCTVDLTQDRSVSAAWASASSVLLSVSVAGGGTVTGGGITCPSTCSAPEPPNSTVELTATPAAGYTFSGWGGDCTDTAPTCSVVMDTAKSVTATFKQVANLTVAVNGPGNVTGEGGTINCGNNGTVCSASFPLGKTVTLTATAAVGAAFVGWSGACGGSALTCTVAMTSDRTVTATFTTNAAPLTVSVTGPGVVSGAGINCGSGASTCTANEALNSSVTLTASPAAGATFAGWGGACTGTAATCTLSMTGPRTVSATFSQTTSSVPLTVSVSGRGRVTGAGIDCGSGATVCSANVTLNTTVVLVAQPEAGASLLGWGGACGGTATTCSFTVTAATSVSATFSAAASETALTIAVVGRGSVASVAGRCTGRGARKTCVQRFARGTSVVLAATPAAGARFVRWSGACAGAKRTCTVQLESVKAVTATFTGAVVLTRLGPASVRKASGAFLVTLRFRTTRGGLARIRVLRAGLLVTQLWRRVAAGPATIGPLRVSRPGPYTFEVRLAGGTLRWRSCLGRCSAQTGGRPFGVGLRVARP